MTSFLAQKLRELFFLSFLRKVKEAFYSSLWSVQEQTIHSFRTILHSFHFILSAEPEDETRASLATSQNLNDDDFVNFWHLMMILREGFRTIGDYKV
jgi:hypothetical protein